MGVFGALLFVVVFILGSAILLATGIPLTGGLANMIFAIFIVTVGAKIIDKFGANIIMLTIAGILAIPTLTWGPPGLQKVPMLFVMGLAIDLAVMLFRRENKGYILGGIICGFIAPGLTYITLILVGLPGADRLQPILIPLSLAYGVLAFVGGYLGVTAYDRKLSHLSVIKKLKE